MNDNFVLYEFGYHIASSLSEAEVMPLVESFKKLVTDNGGAVVAEEVPQLISLSYPIPQHSDLGIKTFSQAYFGWFKFELAPEKLQPISSTVKSNQNVIRFLLTKTDKGNTITYHKPVVQEVSENLPAVTPVGVDMDQQIENLIVE